MEITTVRKTDHDILRMLFLTERQRTFSWLDPATFQLNDFDQNTKGEVILVARIGGIPVGFISIWMRDRFIHHLYVDEQYHGKGIGTALLKAAIDKTGLPITLKCLENNTKAIIFYTKKVFIITERGRSEYGAYIVFELTENVN